MTTSAKQDIYQTVTDSIVGMLEKGVRPWAPQWEAGSCGLPAIPTRANGESYRGINVALLWGAAEMKGYRHHTWMTFNQAKELGGCVRKGEKSTPIVYWGSYAKEDENGEEETRLFAKGYAVFNVEQIDHLPERFYEAAPVVETAERIKLADQWAVGTGADIRHGGAKAFFSPKSDHVQMPPLEAFYERDAYYATLAHELTHWSGAKARLDRQFGKRFGDKAYAFEELVAELGAAFAMARLGIAAEPREDHASYLASWLKVLKSDKRAIFTAASKAQAACDYLFKLADNAPKQAVERPWMADGVIYLPDLSGGSSGPEIESVEDDDDTDPTPPVAPSPGPGPIGFAGGFLSQLTAFKPGGVRASRPFHPRRDPSLCEFLSVKGICDDGGELQARDLDRWHREAPFRRKLVRPDGVSLERAAFAAWEAGYFDDVAVPSWDSSDNMHPVSEAMLLEALERELRSDYAHVWAEHDEEFFA